jgi:transposase-like protein
VRTGRARAGGLQLTAEGGLLAQLTKRLVESALEGEITDHLGYDSCRSVPQIPLYPTLTRT